MKFCKECTHCGKFDPKRPDLARCLHPVTEDTGVSNVTGGPLTLWKNGPLATVQDYLPFCESVRKDDGYCGPDAKLFSPANMGTADRIMGEGEGDRLRTEERIDAQEWRANRCEP